MITCGLNLMVGDLTLFSGGLQLKLFHIKQRAAVTIISAIAVLNYNGQQ